MQQAMYSADNVGHFGLAYPAYTHFTSPIRRYPDLIVHRIIKHLLAGGTRRGPGLQPSPTSSRSASTAPAPSGAPTRRPATPSDWLKCEFMQDKLGEQFEGTITSVTSFGIFVQLDEIYVDGLVHITALDNDYYHFDPIGHRLDRRAHRHRLPPGRPAADPGGRGQSGRAQDRLRSDRPDGDPQGRRKGPGARTGQRRPLCQRPEVRPTSATRPRSRPNPCRFREPRRKPSRSPSANPRRSPRRTPRGAASASSRRPGPARSPSRRVKPPGSRPGRRSRSQPQHRPQRLQRPPSRGPGLPRSQSRIGRRGADAGARPRPRP